MPIETIISLIGAITGTSAVVAVAIKYFKDRSDKSHDEGHHGALEIADASGNLADRYIKETAQLRTRLKEEETRSKEKENEFVVKIEYLTSVMNDFKTRLMELEVLLEKTISGSWDLYFQVKGLDGEPMYTPPERRDRVSQSEPPQQ